MWTFSPDRGEQYPILHLPTNRSPFSYKIGKRQPTVRGVQMEDAMIRGGFHLYNRDCVGLMRSGEVSGVNLIVTSPPYNVMLGNNKYRKAGYKSYEDNLPYGAYIRWMTEFAATAYEVLAEDGRICLNIGDGRNGKVTTHSDLWGILKDVGFLPLSTIIWNKNTTSNRMAWGSFMSPSCPSFPSQMEYILCAGKTEKLIHKGTPTITRDEFIGWSNPIWNMKPEVRQSRYGHPAMFPVELPYRCISEFTYREDIVFDPFMGVGTTGIACVKTERCFVGCEIDGTYYNTAKRRILNEQNHLRQMELSV